MTPLSAIIIHFAVTHIKGWEIPDEAGTKRHTSTEGRGTQSATESEAGYWLTEP